MSYLRSARKGTRGLLQRYACALAIMLGVVGMLATSASAATWTPTDAAAFTTALNNSALGDTIILQAGTVYTSPFNGFVLPNKTSGSGYITIQSSNLASLPAAGVRVNLSHASNMPKIKPPAYNSAAIKTATSAHHFKMIGLEVIGTQSGTLESNADLIALGHNANDGTQDQLSEVPNNIIIDRCIIRAESDTHRIKRGVGLNSASTDITNSYLTNIKHTGADSQAIGGFNGPGPFNIINNFLEGGGENVMFGGDDPRIPNLVPSDIVIQRNHFTKRLSWNRNMPATWDGITWVCKNAFELKNARNVTLESNIFENSFQPSQDGYLLGFSPRNQGGNAPWCIVENVTVRNNIWRNAACGISLLGDDNNFPSGRLNHVTIENNLIYGIGGSQWGAAITGRLYAISRGTVAVTINHNTAFHTDSGLFTDGPIDHTGFVFTNNILAHNSYCANGPTGQGSVCLTDWYPGCVFQKNILMNNTGLNLTSLFSQHTMGWSPANLAFPTSWGVNTIAPNGVLVNQASPGSDFAGYKVVTNSVYHNGGTDGTDLGCNIDTINTATAGCISGVWSGGGGGGGTTTVTLKNGVNGYNGNTSFGVSGQLPTWHGSASDYKHATNALSGSNNYVYRAYYKFDVSSIPASAVITSATLQLKAEYSTGAPSNGNISIHRMSPVNNGFAVNYATATRNTYNGSNSWTGGANSGGDVANSNNDFLDTPDSTTTLPAEGSIGNITFNVTSSVQAWVNGAANNGWVVLPAARLAYLSTSADLQGSAEFPVLTVTYQSTPPSVTKVMKNGVSGYTGNASFGVSGQVPTSHGSSADYKHVVNSLAGSNGYVYRAFYKFDLTQGANAIPANAVIESATLKVKIEYTTGSTDRTIKIHRARPVNNAFTINYANATRNTYNGTNAWTGGANAGGDVANSNNDFVDTPDATATLPADGSYMTVNVTPSVQAWVNGEANNGWLWITNAIVVYMGTAGDLQGSADFPELTVTYH